MNAENPSAELMRLVNGYQVSQAIHVAATLGIADLVAEHPLSSEDLAAATNTRPGPLYRLLRALAAVGIFVEEAEQRFGLTPMGECLRSDATRPVGPWAAYIGRPYSWTPWSGLLDCVRTGESPFRSACGMNPFTYRSRSADERVAYDHAMAAHSRRAVDALVSGYDFGRFNCIVDVGGGRGVLLGAILASNPSSSGVLFDQPQVASSAIEVLEQAGVADRCKVVGGNFFHCVPRGGDAYVYKSILHDWDDADAAAILRICRRDMRPDATLLVIGRAVASSNESVETTFSDLNMLVTMGGKERKREEFAALFAAAGFHLASVTPTRTSASVLEGVPS